MRGGTAIFTAVIRIPNLLPPHPMPNFDPANSAQHLLPFDGINTDDKHEPETLVDFCKSIELGY